MRAACALVLLAVLLGYQFLTEDAQIIVGLYVLLAALLISGVWVIESWFR